MFTHHMKTHINTLVQHHVKTVKVNIDLSTCALYFLCIYLNLVVCVITKPYNTLNSWKTRSAATVDPHIHTRGYLSIQLILCLKTFISKECLLYKKAKHPVFYHQSSCREPQPSNLQDSGEEDQDIGARSICFLPFFTWKHNFLTRKSQWC